MALKLDWLGLADGTVLDSRQALTIVGFNQNVVSTDTLPTKWTSQLLVMIVEEEPAPVEDPGKLEGYVHVSISDPQGKEIGSVSQSVSGVRKISNVPVAVMMAILVAFDISSYGRYDVTASFGASSEDENQESLVKSLYVVKEKS